MAKARGSLSSSSPPTQTRFRGKNPPLPPPSREIFAAYGAHARRFLFTWSHVFPALAADLPACNKVFAPPGSPWWKYSLTSCAVRRKSVGCGPHSHGKTLACVCIESNAAGTAQLVPPGHTAQEKCVTRHSTAPAGPQLLLLPRLDQSIPRALSNVANVHLSLRRKPCLQNP